MCYLLFVICLLLFGVWCLFVVRCSLLFVICFFFSLFFGMCSLFFLFLLFDLCSLFVV